ncbi:MAG: alpha/beta fold hydrolase [Bdellovibrionales bacterium]|nr:alpha/beta fold hydrolase [Bdellovibrionales bacterium]
MDEAQKACRATTARESMTLAELITPEWELPWLLNHKVWGDQHQETIVLIHGVTGDFRTFEHIARSLSQFYRVVGVDLRGMGETPAYGWNYSSRVLAKDVRKLLSHLEMHWSNPPASYHVLGHSFGGRVAIGFCDLFPSKVRSLIVEDMHFGTYAGAGKETLLTGAKNAVAALRQQNPDQNMQGMLQDSSPDRWKAVREKGYVVSLFASQVRAEEYSGELRRLRAPVLLIGAAEYKGALQEGGVRHARSHLANNPFVRIEAIPGTGHDVHNDNPDGYLRVVGTFIADVIRN